MKPRQAFVALVLLALVAMVILAIFRYSRGRERAATPADPSRGAADPSGTSALLEPERDAGLFVSAGFVAPRETVRDERLRSQLRDALARVFATESPVASRDAASGAGAAPISAMGNLDPGYIRERIRGDFIPMASRGYDLLLSRRPGFGGRMVLRFRITAHEQLGGIVEDVSVAPARSANADAGLEAGASDASAPSQDASRSVFGDDAFETCVRESMMTVAFAPPPRGGTLTVSYPIGLAPDEPQSGRDAAR